MIYLEKPPGTELKASVLTFMFFLLMIIFLLPSLLKEKQLDLFVKKGSLEYTQTELKIIPLTGEWEFYDNNLTLSPQTEPDYAVLPSIWEDKRFGYATYRMTIQGLIPDHAYAIKTPYMSTAFILFIDGEPLYANGRLGTSKDTSSPGYLPGVIPVRPTSSSIEIILQVSNFHHRRGGPFQTIFFGEEEPIVSNDYWAIFKDAAFALIFFTMGFYLLIFSLLKRDKLVFILSLLFLTIGFSGFSGTTEVIIFQCFPSFNWFIYEKLDYLSTYIIPLLILMFINNIYRNRNKNHLWVVSGPLFLIYGIILFTSVSFFTRLNTYFQIYAFIIYTFTLKQILSALIKNEAYSKLILLIFLIFLGSAISSTFFSHSWISTGTYLPLSFLQSIPFLAKINNISPLLEVISFILWLLFIQTASLIVTFKNSSAIKHPIKIKEEDELLAIQNKMDELGFSEREKEVCMLILQGKSNIQIADQLCLSLSTIKTYVSRIFKKTSVKSRNELFFYFH